MRGRITLLVTAMCLGLAGCGTNYQEMGFSGGLLPSGQPQTQFGLKRGATDTPRAPRYKTTHC